ncbi:MAG: histidinol-phosphatase HisJ family protein [Spirochaetes bacterium]|nr:histidinol-phosphatase HisJ family protein [Spirochaetota bacterium]
MGLVDYHNHTSLCGHATGSLDDYIEVAIEKGLAEIGFADHAPLPEGLREGITMYPEQIESYLSSIAACAEKYKHRIKVRTGLEVDFPLHNTFDKNYLTDERIDYLIGSCHIIDGWLFDHPDHIDGFSTRDIDEIYKRYYEILHDLIKSGYFQILGHFDLVKKFGHRAKKDFSKEISSLFAGSSQMIAVEINTAGLRKPVGEIYPSGQILSLLFSLDVPVTLGSDAHAPDEVAYEFAKAVELLKKTGYRKISSFQKRKRYDIVV